MSEETPIRIRRAVVTFPAALAGRTSWIVEYPDPFGHWECCQRREDERFDTHPEALSFALKKIESPDE